MKILGGWLVGALLVLGLAGTAAAAVTLWSPQLWVLTSQEALCTVLHTGTRAIDVVVSFSNGDTSSCQSLGPGQACFAYGNDGAFGYCKAVIVGGNKTTVRGIAQVRNASGPFTTDFTTPIE